MINTTLSFKRLMAKLLNYSSIGKLIYSYTRNLNIENTKLIIKINDKKLIVS